MFIENEERSSFLLLLYKAKLYKDFIDPNRKIRHISDFSDLTIKIVVCTI